MKIAVIGTGYVGLVAGACFADAGTEVVCVDVDQAKLDRLQNGEVPFFEPGLDRMVKRNWPDRLSFTTDLSAAVRGSSAVFIAVGTPPQEDGSADLSMVLKVAEDVCKVAAGELVLVCKSTVPVGTNDKVLAVVKEHSHGKNIMVASNPEFLKEGDALGDFLKPDRIVIGVREDRAFEILSRLYLPFNRQQNRIHRMDPRSAEIVKYAANAMLATKISFMNEIALLCDHAEGDVEKVRLAVGADQRIGFPFLYPGLGFGGSCFPKDLRALVSTGEDYGVSMDVSKAAVVANRKPVERMLEHMRTELGGFKGKHIALWGLSFKPKTDDVREAPAFTLIEAILKEGGTVAGSDPEALETSQARLNHMGLKDGVALTSDPYKAIEGADALVLCTEWRQFNSPNLVLLKERMRGNRIYDGRNVWIADEFTEADFLYRGVGRR